MTDASIATCNERHHLKTTNGRDSRQRIEPLWGDGARPSLFGHARRSAASLARPKGLEPLTGGLEIHCSIQLSYGRVWAVKYLKMRRKPTEFCSVRVEVAVAVGFQSILQFQPAQVAAPLQVCSERRSVVMS